MDVDPKLLSHLQAQNAWMYRRTLAQWAVDYLTCGAVHGVMASRRRLAPNPAARAVWTLHDQRPSLLGALLDG